MPKEITNIHDKFIKHILSDKVLAIEFLSEYLPSDLVTAINFETLTYENTSYISESLRASYSDMVWRAKIYGKKSLKICLLVEHKSYADQYTAFQLLEYLASGYRKQIQEGRKAEVIIPILYYHGKTQWVYRSVDSHFADYPQFLKKYIPAFFSELVNLRDVPPRQILALKNGLLSSAIMLQKYYFDAENLNLNIKAIVENLNPYLESNVTDAIFVYMIQNERLDEKPFMEFIKNLPANMSAKVMSLYDQLIERGIQKGMEKGMEKGIQKTVERTVLNAFDTGIAVATIRVITGESEESINLILKQNSRIR